MLTQDKTEEIQINLAQLQREGENYRGSGWGKKKMNRVFSLLQKYVDFEEGRYEVLDLGCGGMTLGKELQDIPSFNVTGVDLVFQLLCTLSKKRTPHIPLVAGDIESLPFQDDTFDLIAHNQVLHHFLSRHIALSEVTRVLKAGGGFFLVSKQMDGIPTFITGTIPPKAKRRISLAIMKIPLVFSNSPRKLRRPASRSGSGK